MDDSFERTPNSLSKPKKTGIQRQPMAVVINSGDSNGYGVILNLGRNNIPVLTIDSNPENITFASKYAKKVLSPNYKLSIDDYIDFLIELGKSCQTKPVLFVTGDLILISILKYRHILEKYFHMPIPSLEVASLLIDKVAFYQMLDEYDIPHAETYIPRSLFEAEQISKIVQYPCIVKPVQSTSFSVKFGNKCLRTDSPEELIDVYKKVSDEDQVIIQREISGVERYLVYVYFDNKSRSRAVCCYKKIRTQPIDYGNACVCKTVWKREAVDLCFKVLNKIGYTGIAEAEVQRDARDGIFKLVEINARTTTEARLPAKCGINIEYICYCDMLGIQIGDINPGKLNVIWIDIIRDITAVFSRRGYLDTNQITLKEWLKSLRGEREYAYLAFDDILPFILIFYRFVRTYAFNRKIVNAFKRLLFLNPSKP